MIEFMDSYKKQKVKNSMARVISIIVGITLNYA